MHLYAWQEANAKPGEKYQVRLIFWMRIMYMKATPHLEFLYDFQTMEINYTSLQRKKIRNGWLIWEIETLLTRFEFEKSQLKKRLPSIIWYDILYSFTGWPNACLPIQRHCRTTLLCAYILFDWLLCCQREISSTIHFDYQ